MLPDLINLILAFAKEPCRAMKRCQAATRTYEKRVAFFEDVLAFPPELGALAWGEGQYDDVHERTLLTQYFANCARRYDRYGCQWCPENMHLHINMVYELHLMLIAHDDTLITLCSFPVFGHLDDIIQFT